MIEWEYHRGRDALMNSTKYFVTWIVFYGLLVLTGLLGFCTMLLVGWITR